MFISQLIRQISEQLRKGGVDTPIREARLIVQHALNIPYLTIITDPTYELSQAQVEQVKAWSDRRSAREPLSKIMGKKEFWGIEFHVNQHTLDPRPDSETLIEAVLSSFPDKKYPWKILDLGTGSGCLILSLLKEYPNAQGVGIDNSQEALNMAYHNARHHNLTDRFTGRQGYWTQEIEGIFDIIISNPPYIALNTPLEPEVLNFDPPQALFAGKDGLMAYREIAQDVGRIMDTHSRLFIEIGIDQHKMVDDIFLSNGFNAAETRQDLANIIRCLIFCKKDT